MYTSSDVWAHLVLLQKQVKKKERFYLLLSAGVLFDAVNLTMSAIYIVALIPLHVIGSKTPEQLHNPFYYNLWNLGK